MSDDADRTQLPTPRRRQQARQSGHVAHSHDLGSAVLLVGGLGLMLVTGGAVLTFLVEFLQSSLSGQAWLAASGEAAHESVVDQSRTLFVSLGQRLLPLLAGTLLLGVAAHTLQTGMLFMPGRMMPDFSRVNPANGLARIYSVNSFIRLIFGLGKLCVVAAVGAAGLWSRREALVSLTAFDVPELAIKAWQACLWSCLEMAGALLGLAVLDYLYQRYRYEKSLLMTPQEVRQEMRELQGDPQIAARRRQLHAGRRAENVPVDRRAIATSTTQLGAVDSIP
jgi:flagellar biosynthetic protein FlhB